MFKRWARAYKQSSLCSRLFLTLSDKRYLCVGMCVLCMPGNFTPGNPVAWAKGTSGSAVKLPVSPGLHKEFVFGSHHLLGSESR